MLGRAVLLGAPLLQEQRADWAHKGTRNPGFLSLFHIVSSSSTRPGLPQPSAASPFLALRARLAVSWLWFCL